MVGTLSEYLKEGRVNKRIEEVEESVNFKSGILIIIGREIRER